MQSMHHGCTLKLSGTVRKISSGEEGAARAVTNSCHVRATPRKLPPHPLLLVVLDHVHQCALLPHVTGKLHIVPGGGRCVWVAGAKLRQQESSCRAGNNSTSLPCSTAVPMFGWTCTRPPFRFYNNPPLSCSPVLLHLPLRHLVSILHAAQAAQQVAVSAAQPSPVPPRHIRNGGGARCCAHDTGAAA